MSTKIGNLTVSKIYVGNTEIDKIYIGGSKVYERSTPVSTIEFSIDDTPYQAINGMTWAQWVASEYNTDGFYIQYNKIQAPQDAGTVSYSLSGAVPPSDVIEANYQYELVGGN